MLERRKHAPFKFASLDDLRKAIRELDLQLDVEEDISCLCEPISLAGRIIPNRMACQPMEGCDATPDGAPSDLTFRRYQRFAAGGSGIVWVEACAVVPEGRANPRQLWIHSKTVDAFARLLDNARRSARDSLGSQHCPLFVLQLTHSGRYSKSGRQPAPIIAFHDPFLDPTCNISPDMPVISDCELEALEEKYVQAARLAYQAGFDAIDIKSCHRYMVNELLAAHTREGQYGGTYENRTKFLKNIASRIREELGRDKLVVCRLNIHDAHPYPYGWGMDPGDPTKPNLDEPHRLVRELHELGLPLINMTMGNPYHNPHVNRPFDRPIEGGKIPDEHPLVGEERLINLVRETRKGIPELVIIGSGYSWLRHLWPYVAAAEIRKRNIQIVGLGRQAFAYPDFAKEIIETGKLDRRHTCITCSGCTQIMRDGGMTGCVPFDSQVYGPIYREGRRNDIEFITKQASRCRTCFDARCVDGCPAGVDIPGFVRALADGDIQKSYEILRERNVLPEICGRVCPAEVQCEGYCLEKIFSGEPVPIQSLQLYVSRVARENGWTAVEVGKPTGKRVAVVGAGPSGVACAAELIRLGHSVDILSGDNTGGVAALAIPAERLEIDAFEAEMKALFEKVPPDRLRVSHTRLSPEYNLDNLLDRYDAVFLGIGLASSQTLTSESSNGHLAQNASKGEQIAVQDALTFLERCKKGKANLPPRVAVIGGGNTALDAACQAILAGARDVYIIYRRSFREMPAWPGERNRALDLGVHILALTQPVGYQRDADGRLIGVRIARTILGDPDPSGRRAPIPVPQSESLLEVDMVVEAIGQRLPPGIDVCIPGVDLTPDGLIKVDDQGRTSRKRVYAGGDATNGGDTVVRAVAEGMRAARTIDRDF